MANIQLPSQGQPIDYSYINQIVTTLNDVSTKVSANYSNSRIGSGDGSIPETKRLSDLSVVALYKVVTTEQTVKTKTEKSFSIPFGITFKNIPIVTITPQALSGDAGRDISVVINKIEKDSVSGWVAFNAAGTTSVAVNVIAIGIPNA